MASNKKKLGDTHNFGRAVEILNGKKIFKPRPLIWEWILLSEKSQFRQAFEDINLKSPILVSNFLPLVKFSQGDLFKSGYQELVTSSVKPLTYVSKEDQLALCLASGQFLALATWLGIEDLHYENIVVGKCGSEIKLGPIDIECILSTLKSPMSTSLIPSEKRRDIKNCGLQRILPFLARPLKSEFILACLFGYVEQLRLISENQNTLLRSLRNLKGINQVPIRFLFRGTFQYVRWLRKQKNKDRPMIEGELVQLRRGDIPYFFRTLSESKRVCYYSDSSLNIKKELSPRQKLGLKEKLLPFMSLEKGWSTNQFQSFSNTGTLLFFATLDRPRIKGVFDFMGSEMKITKTTVSFNFLNGPQLEGPRKWDDICGSLYDGDPRVLKKKALLLSSI